MPPRRWLGGVGAAVNVLTASEGAWDCALGGGCFFLGRLSVG